MAKWRSVLTCCGCLTALAHTQMENQAQEQHKQIQSKIKTHTESFAGPTIGEKYTQSSAQPPKKKGANTLLWTGLRSPIHPFTPPPVKHEPQRRCVQPSGPVPAARILHDGKPLPRMRGELKQGGGRLVFWGRVVTEGEERRMLLLFMVACVCYP